MPEVAFPEGYQRALVTGATSGIGKAIVLALRDAGLQVIAVGRSPEALAELACEPGVTTLQADVRDYRSLAATLEGQAVDVLVNNAGILSTRAAFQDIDEAEIDNMLDINLKAPLHLARQVLPGMVGRGRGHLFFIGSSAGRAPHPGAAVYGASKAGVSLFCDALRCDLLGSGVRVTEIAPGRVQTQLYKTAMGLQAAGSELYDGYESIQPVDIAQLLLAALKMPRQVDVSRLEVFPTAQAVGGGRMVKTAG
ncbi:SDR family NAD(P)-dependent oxidoreductase [Pseudomonas monteilii]|uniref:NADP-dependent 3-hydroxy acid dehydrogenase YdfG n=2 Tax=Pseudomonas TaxID=286 RepID=A0A6G6UXT7_9PSED|nr:MULTISPECIES: SDR family oxidoreductase [Pseudomonas]AVH39220.1 SDR family NAD(P)-dependent oxidoreductase [Pseudomonas monteilii]MBA6138249.1 SDR family oxidoreductase [Pseudomonas monteilii]MBV4514870.1 SDR family oxidoreductase [Pseudomonas kurunegalensis]MCA4075143.1 SDR family oxidoreductase [Pseudomonas kurunegalensis]MCE0908836.1 SDR family oxidoreductase [Pseudomonas kurunegalensis]